MSNLDTIASLRDALANLNQDALVFIDNRPPTALSSYRGYYEQLAIERSGRGGDATTLDERAAPFDSEYLGRYRAGHNEVQIKSEPTVGEMVKALDLAVGETFEGYKGGQYTMWDDTPLWVSEYGNCDRLVVSSIETFDGRVDLLTTEVDS